MGRWHPLAVAFAYFILAYACLAFTRFGSFAQALWLSNALLAAALVSRPTSKWPQTLLLAAFGHLLAHVAIGDTLRASMSFLAADLSETALFACLFSRWADACAASARLAGFVVSSILSALMSAVVLGSLVLLTGPPPIFHELVIWFAADTLGLVVFFPLFHGLAETQWRKVRERPRLFSLLVVAVVAVGVVGAVTQSPIPRLIFLPLIVGIAFEFGVAGALTGLGTLLVVWTAFTVGGYPPSAWPGFDEARGVLLLVQLYVAAVAITVIPLAVFLEERERSALKLAGLAREEGARVEAERAHEFKSRLIAMASHDLRQPLQAAHAYVDILSNRLLDQQLKSVCENASYALDSIGSILDALLDVSRLDAGVLKPTMCTFDLQPILERVAASVKPMADEKSLHLTTPTEACFVVSDPLLLERIISNFISNAIRYTHTGEVRVWTQTSKDGVSVGVTDTGVGISPSEFDRVFQEYQQLDGDRHPQGLGLGLSIAKRMASLMGYTISLRSELGVGSTFAVDGIAVSAEQYQTPAAA
ncbi:MAG: ATP-binding protein [Terricaulis sp.]